jgi:hypothetical protein
VLHVSEDSLGSAWHAALRAADGAPDDRTSPDGVGRGVAVGTRPGDQNVSPSISPDGRYLAFFSSRSLFGFDVYVAESATGRIVKQLTSVTGDHRFDALSFIGTAGTWSPDGRKFAFALYAEGNNEIDVVDVESGRTERRIRPAGIGAISDPAWSPDGSRIAFFGFTSPVAGGRYRFEVAPYAGSLNHQTALVDYRHYFFARPLTVAVLRVFVGRFGPDGESVRLQPMFIGQPSLLRGYDASDFSVHDCTARPLSADSCPEYTRLSGSRIGVVNAELRIPLFGTEQFGLIRFPYLPTEIAPFVNAGVAWNTSGPLSLRFDQGTPDRVPVFSSGVAARFNLFGAVVLEVYWVHP